MPYLASSVCPITIPLEESKPLSLRSFIVAHREDPCMIVLLLESEDIYNIKLAIKRTNGEEYNSYRQTQKN